LTEIVLKEIRVRLMSWILDLTSEIQDGGHDVISCRKLLSLVKLSSNWTEL